MTEEQINDIDEYGIIHWLAIVLGLGIVCFVLFSMITKGAYL